ncbi:MAG: hypothetical protein AB7N61_13390 [Acidimicrobiia bacterium]
MSRFEIGLATLLVPDHGGRELQVTDFGGDTHDAWEMPAVVAAPDGLLMEIAYQRWDGAGAVVALSRGDSAPAYDRLIRGERLSVKAREDGAEHVVADLLQWDPTEGPNGWGSAKKATPEELDSTLGASAETLLFQAGALDFGTRAKVLGDRSNAYKNRLAVVFPGYEPLGPLAVYVLTRVLPIVKARLAS